MPILLSLLLGSTLRNAALLPRVLGRRSLATLSGANTSPRLLLTSDGLTTARLQQSFHRMLDKACDGASSDRSIAMLVTAAMVSSNEDSKRSPGDRRRRRWADARKKGRELEARLGVPVECIDCARPETIADAERALERAGCIWVSGGNTFFLWHWMRESGVSSLIQRRVLAEGALYVGTSAGSIVAGHSVGTAFWKGWDDPNAAPDVDWAADGACDAMALTPDAVSFFPHYSSEWDALVESKRTALGHECICLSDDGAGAYVVGDKD